MVSLMFFGSEILHLDNKLQNEVTTDISKGYKTTNKAWLMYLEGEQQKYKFYWYPERRK